MTTIRRTYATLRRKMRVDECFLRLDADALSQTLHRAGATGEIVVLAAWEGEQLHFEAGDERLRDRLREFEVAHLIWLVSQPLPVRPDRLRWTFECPQCGRRCRQLYARWTPDRLLCRLCHRLSYESAQTWDNWSRRGWPGGLLGRMCREIARGGDGTKAIERAADRDSRQSCQL